MTEKFELLTALNTILLTADPTPLPKATAAFSYPEQWGEINDALVERKLPIFTVQEVVNRPFTIRRLTMGKSIHWWDVDIRLYLHKGLLTKHEYMAAADTKQRYWLYAISKVLFANMTLSGTAHVIGQNSVPGDLFTYRTGHMNWQTNTYWGIALTLTVAQILTQEMTS